MFVIQLIGKITILLADRLCHVADTTLTALLAIAVANITPTSLSV